LDFKETVRRSRKKWDDMLTDAFDNDEDEEEADQITAQVLAELEWTVKWWD
jgi:hypothetical protein